MILLRNEQVQVLQDEYPAFEKRIAAWLKSQFPEDCEMLGENGLHQKIRYGAQVAVQYGFPNRREASKFVFLCFLLGPNFDLEPDYQWLRTIFLNSSVGAAARMQNAFETLATRLETGRQKLGRDDESV